MSKLIDQQMAIDALNAYEDVVDTASQVFTIRGCKKAITNLPSAQPERLADDDFETIRIHLSAYKEELCNQHRWKEAEEYQRIIDRFMAFAYEQPEIIMCKNCKWFYEDRWCIRYLKAFLPKDFCSYGERIGKDV